jgi:outer membrane protein assembly factor BamB
MLRGVASHLARLAGLAVFALALVAWAPAARAQVATPKSFDPPGPTGWAPSGCRAVPPLNPVLDPRTAWRNFHADATGSDEIFSALAPVFAADWIAEPDTFNVTGPVFDSDGNLYFAPLLPYENVVLISSDPHDGSRRWAIAGTGAPAGAGTPMVLDDPLDPGAQIVFLGLYDRALAVRTDGSVAWDVPTGLTLPTDTSTAAVFGVNYLPASDAIVGLTLDGFLYALDRTSGAPLLSAPHQLPGEPTPPSDPSGIPQFIRDRVEAELSAFMDIPPGTDGQLLLDLLQGNGSEVSNFFSIDPHTGRLWVAATAPDAEDGTLDGVSELGALYGLDLVENGSSYDVVEACHRYFAGGSASTPALRADGTRIYVGDNEGKLIAVDSTCNDLWTLEIGAQIVASVGVASDNEELYVATKQNIIQVIDLGSSAVVGWTADLDVWNLPSGHETTNLNLVSIGANAVSFQAGAGTSENLPRTTGVGVLDRATGAVRYFAGGLDESVAAMNTGPDGALYMGNSPFRRAFARAFFPFATPALVGGIRKFAPERLDLLIRDAACAAADRAANAAAVRATCPNSVLADLSQIQGLIGQARSAAPKAIADSDLEASEWASMNERLTRAESHLARGRLVAAEAQLRSVCTGAPPVAPPAQVPSLSTGALALLCLVLLVAGAGTRI